MTTPTIEELAKEAAELEAIYQEQPHPTGLSHKQAHLIRQQQEAIQRLSQDLKQCAGANDSLCGELAGYAKMATDAGKEAQDLRAECERLRADAGTGVMFALQSNSPDARDWASGFKVDFSSGSPVVSLEKNNV